MTAVVERRGHQRIALKGTAILLAGEHVVRARITNLSEGGFLASTLVSAPARMLGRTVDIELRLDDPQAKWIRLEGKIVRIVAETVAVSFIATSALIRLVDAMGTASRARLRVLSVVLIDEDDQRRAVIAEGFRAVGCNVIEAPTSLEAIVRLGEASFEPDVIAVADSIPMASANEMRRFIGQHHPHVKLVAISDDAAEPIEVPHQLSSIDVAGNLTGIIRTMLAKPRR